MEGKLENELDRISEDKQELLRVAMTFYSCKTVRELPEAIKERLSTEGYTYNHPYYNCLLQIIEEEG